MRPITEKQREKYLRAADFYNHSQPTWENQLWHARKLLQEKGIEAVDNPHGMIGRTCGCGSCFCCAAAKVVKQYQQAMRDAETCSSEELEAAARFRL